ncbi:MAG: cystathionine beta-lyase [Rickettsiales bacterium]|jgi:cystathionine beta-lyase|nr:cystathionine beta-lyase [Rickettsiales bacterium]
MKKETLAIQAGRRPLEHEGSVNPPIHQTSTILFPTLNDYYEAERGTPFYQTSKHTASDETAMDYGYGISTNPTVFALQEACIALEGADHALIYPSGLQAITSALLAFLKAGDHILVVDTIYGPTRRFCNNELKRFGVETTFYDPLIGEGIRDLIQDNTRIVFTESPGSITFEIQDIPTISRVAKSIREDIIILMDNSWATPLFFDPFAHGVDVAIQAATKYIGGHSDVLLGIVTCKKKHFSALYRNYRHLGASPSPHACYLAQRGIRTLAVRLKQHQETALSLAKQLKNHPKVSRVLHPALPDCPGHELWKRDFTGATGLFSIILDRHYNIPELSKMIDPMKHFGIGCSWGGFESLILALNPVTVRTAAPWKAEGSLIRIYAGLEAVEDLAQDFEDALKRL